MKYFFRGQEDGFVLNQFGIIHIILLIIWVLGIYLIIKNKDKLKNNKKILPTIAIILFIDQIILYLWQGFSGVFDISLSLPLYHCRISVWLIILSIYLKNDKLKVIAIYWGVLGTLFGMLMPDLYKFSFPHYTNFQYFLVHITLGYIIAYFIFVEKFSQSPEDLSLVLKVTNFFNLFVVAINLYLLNIYPEVNYGFLIAPPKILEEIVNLNRGLYIILILIMYNIIIYILYILIKKIELYLKKCK